MKPNWSRIVGVVSVGVVGLMVATLALAPGVAAPIDVHQTIVRLLRSLLEDHAAMDRRLDGIVGQLDVIDAKLNDKPSIKHLAVASVPIEHFFRIDVFCNASFQVKAVYGIVTANETVANTTDIIYTEVSATGNFVGGGFPSAFLIRNTDFDPGPGPASLAAYELLSQLQVELPVGVPGGGTFEVGGEVEFGPIGSTFLSAGAVVETAQAVPCFMTILG